jgi:hypothetical protein
LAWTLQTCANARYEAFHVFCNVTAIVWDIFKDDRFIGAPVSANNIISRFFHGCFTAYTALCFAPPVVSSLFANVGLLMLLLLLTGIFALSRNGVSELFLVVPSVCYNLGTMRLLCGNDVRFSTSMW